MLYLKCGMRKTGDKAKIKEKMVVNHFDSKILIDKRNTLIMLSKRKNGQYLFCVQKLKKTGRSGLLLYEDEFIWV